LILKNSLDVEKVEYELRSGTAGVRLGVGLLTIGRSIDCQIVLDSISVSRRHARVGLKNQQPVVIDLGSANGVYVNGQRVNGERVLAPGDTIVIGDQELRLVKVSARDPVAARSLATMPGVSAAPGIRLEPEENTGLRDAVELMGAVADRLIERGDLTNAKEVLGPRLVNVLQRARSAKLSNKNSIESAALSALRLASATRDPTWVDYVVLLHDAASIVFSEQVIETMHEVVRKVPRIQVSALRHYIERMGDADLSTHDRFLLQRLSGLERVAAGR
jgi:pSer/pThr/pTyr-binding forkhead associated (FHA) protein